MKPLLLNILLAGIAGAEMVTGYLYDLFTKEPVSEIKVTLGANSTFTDDDGKFNITWSDKHIAQIEGKGYAPYTLPHPKPGSLEIAMLPGTDEPSKPYRILFNRIIDTAGLYDLHEREDAVWRFWRNLPIPVYITLPGEDKKSENARDAAESAMGEWELNLGVKLFQPLKNVAEPLDYGIIICWGEPGLMEPRSHPRIEYKVDNGWSSALPPNSPRKMARITFFDHQGYYDPKNAMLWALGRVLVGAPSDPKQWNIRDPKSILRLPESEFEVEGNLTSMVKNISADDTHAMRYLLNIPDGTDLKYYYYKDPVLERHKITEGFHGCFGMGLGGGYFARDHWRSEWHHKTGESGPTAVIFPARLLIGLYLWRLGVTGDILGASPIGSQDLQYISGKPNRAHFAALYCAHGDLKFSLSPWRDYFDVVAHGGSAYLTYEVGGYPKYIDYQNAEPIRNSSITYGGELTFKPLGPRYDVAQGFCIPLPPDLTLDYTLFDGLKNTSILTVKLGSLVYPTRASGFPPTELYIFMEQYRNSGSWANMFGFEFATYIFK